MSDGLIGELRVYWSEDQGECVDPDDIYLLLRSDETREALARELLLWCDGYEETVAAIVIRVLTGEATDE